MSLRGLSIQLGIGLLVWIGTFFPYKRMANEVFTEASRVFRTLYAAGLSLTMGAAAFLAWGSEPWWFRYSVLAVCLGFIAFYVALVLIERFR